jgi:hypothetical protein
MPLHAASIQIYREWADVLSVMLHPDIEDSFKAPPEALTDIDYRLWWEDFPEFYEREKVPDQHPPLISCSKRLAEHGGSFWPGNGLSGMA